MNTKIFKSEKGQALILMILAMVVLFGFAALAIDGGMIYSDRRHAQNAADAASLAGGATSAQIFENSSPIMDYSNWNCSSETMTTASQAARNASISRAAGNDYIIDENIGDNNGVTTTCGQFDNISFIDKYIDVRTLITKDTETTFAHFVFSGPLRNTVEAITRVRPRAPLAFGNAIVTLSEECDPGGMVFDGSSTVAVSGGGIFSNSCITASGSVTVGVSGGYDITCVEPDCFTQAGGSGSVSPTPEEGTGVPLPPGALSIPAPDCSALPNRSSPPNGGTIQEGKYNGITLNAQKSLTMEHGLYCLTNDFNIGGNGIVMGDGVTIYLISGNFDAAGSASVNLVAPPARDCTYCPEAIGGVLIYLAKGNDGVVNLRGSSDSNYQGLVYAPDGTIEVGGSGSLMSSIHAQLVAENVKIHGNVDISLSFDDMTAYQNPAMLELYK